MSSEYGLMPGRYPAVVRSYDQVKRTCRVEIPGLTDGGDVLPEAEIEYGIGDKACHGQYPTEIEILPGDTVWIAFIGGDPRYPIITGYRNPQVGNDVDWRRWHHKNIEMLAEEIIHLAVKSSDYKMTTTEITAKADETIRLTVGNSTFTLKPETIEGSTTQALTMRIGSTSVSLTPSGLSLKCGGATVSMTPDSVAINAGRIDLN